MHVQSATNKVIKVCLKDVDSNDKKKVSFKADEAKEKDWVEDTIKKLSKNNGSVSATFIDEMTKEAHYAQQKIKATINNKKPSKS